ncbi:RINT1-like protein MAG2L [Beta vulgaris subsp. vulgaris]|uniref:RINT1-like protein MAG2L n=1 Tax=Beta vulgaris subsp. vulgaris TaxID=3555 RepID=UPI002036CB3D|nr:RINT1-like protein MAG2L [Beta vulgaris subsp. vulgaris]
MINLGEEDVLPKLNEIPEKTLGFINNQGFYFNLLENPSKFEALSMEFNAKCAHLQTHLQNLHTNLGSLLISSSSRSIRAKSSLEDFIFNLENLSIISSYCGNRAECRKIEKIIGKDLPYIARELRRIESIREYAGIALKLETLVGDLEDAILSALDRRVGYTFSRTDPSPSILGRVHAKLDNVHRAVKAINNIEELLLGVLKNHPHWCNLLKAVDARVDKILGVLRPQIIADHRSLLASLGWPPKFSTSNTENSEATGIPNPLVLMQGEKKESYSQSFLALCALQHVQLQREEWHLILLGQKKEETVGLWAIDELVLSIASRIEHHLLKWIGQPEFMFALVYKITHDFIEGVDDVLQPLIDEARLVSCSAKEAWVSSMVQVLSGFLEKYVFPVLAGRYKEKDTKADTISSWLHLIDEIVKFDKRMQSFISSETYVFPGPTTSISALSLFCDRPDWLHIWAKIELKDAWNKVKTELKNEQAWSTDHKLMTENNHYILSTREQYKAPSAAEFALKTAWEMIQRCQTLPGTARRVQFIRSAPGKFLWRFFKVLLLRYKSAQGNLVKVCQLINAARFSEFKLQEWSDDVDLLELRLAETGRKNDSCFFEEEIESLTEMQTNWVMALITHVLHQFENNSFYYFKNVEQFEQVTESDITISDDLVEALDNLRSELLLIKEHLNAFNFLDTWRSIADGLDHFIFRSFLSLDVRLSDMGVKQLMADMEGLFIAFKAFCARPEAFFSCIRDLVKLLKLGKQEVKDLKSNLLDSVKCSDCLLTYSIFSLSVDQTLQILNKRTFFG